MKFGLAGKLHVILYTSHVMPLLWIRLIVFLVMYSVMGAIKPFLFFWFILNTPSR